MLETVYQSTAMLSHRLVHAICCEVFEKGNFKGSATFTGARLVFRTNTVLPDSISFLSHGQNITLKKQKQSEVSVDINEGESLELEGLFSYAKTPSNKQLGDKNLAVIGPRNIVNEAILKEFCEKNLGVSAEIFEVQYVENYLAKNGMIINNCFRLKVSGKVIKSDVVKNNLVFGSGQKKSYGFGLINYKKGAA